MSNTAKKVAAEFPGHVQEHVLTVLHDEGLYRHLRFAKPGTSIQSFSIVTWPGRLCFCGDMGTFVFERLQDMLEFFRHDQPNHGYWAEKCTARDRDGVHVYDPDAFRATAKERVDEAVAELDESTRSEVLATFEDQVLGSADDERDARAALAEFDCCGVSFSDTWEYDFNDFTYRFAWCCEALAWAIKQYDARAVTPALAVGGGAS